VATFAWDSEVYATMAEPMITASQVRWIRIMVLRSSRVQPVHDTVTSVATLDVAAEVTPAVAEAVPVRVGR
jgi:hypothetical protein